MGVMDATDATVVSVLTAVTGVGGDVLLYKSMNLETARLSNGRRT